MAKALRSMLPGRLRRRDTLPRGDQANQELHVPNSPREVRKKHAKKSTKVRSKAATPGIAPSEPQTEPDYENKSLEQICELAGITANAIEYHTLPGKDWEDEAQIPSGIAKKEPFVNEHDEMAWICAKVHAHGTAYMAGDMSRCGLCAMPRKHMGGICCATFYVSPGHFVVFHCTEKQWKPFRWGPDAIFKKDKAPYEQQAAMLYRALIHRGIPQQVAVDKIRQRPIKINFSKLGSGFQENLSSQDKSSMRTDVEMRDVSDLHSSHDYDHSGEEHSSHSQDDSVEQHCSHSQDDNEEQHDHRRGDDDESDDTSPVFSITRKFIAAIVVEIGFTRQANPQCERQFKNHWLTAALAHTLAMLLRDDPFDDWFKRNEIGPIALAVAKQVQDGSLSNTEMFVRVFDLAARERHPAQETDPYGQLESRLEVTLMNRNFDKYRRRLPELGDEDWNRDWECVLNKEGILVIPGLERDFGEDYAL